MKYPVNMVAFDYERNFIGTIFEEPAVLSAIEPRVEVFTDSKHKYIINALNELKKQNKPLDDITTILYFKERGLDKDVPASYITDIKRDVKSAANAEAYYKTLTDKHNKRITYKAAIELAKSLAEATDEEYADLVLDKARMMQDSVNVRNEGFKHIKDVLVGAIEIASEDNGNVTGVTTGFPDVDRILGGWHRNDLVIIGARPSMGKTAFALGLAEAAGAAGAVVPVYSLEMTDLALAQRMLSSRARVNSKRIKQGAGALDDKAWTKMMEAVGELSNYDIEINDSAGIKISQIERDLREMRKKYPDREIVCMIDYLQLILGDERLFGNKTQEMGDISRRLKLLAKELGITIIALSQLSRGVEQRQDKRPMMSDIRESGQIEQDADIIAFLYREEYYGIVDAPSGFTELIISKNREGEVGTVNLILKKDYGRFYTMDRGAYNV